MPKQLFQRPTHVNRKSGASFGNKFQQQDWSRKKGRPKVTKSEADPKKTSADKQKDA